MFKVLFSSLQAFAQTAETTAVAAAPMQAQPGWVQFVPFVIIIGVFYFFLIRPQAKKQKEAQQFLSGLKNGDQVITQAGILGRITGLTDTVATLEVASEVQIKVLRSQILMSQSVLQAKKEGK